MKSPAHKEQDLDTSLGFEAADQIAQPSKTKKVKYNIEECLEILDKPETTRTTLQEQRFAEILIGLGIFDRATFGNLEPHAFLQKLMPIIKHEVYFPGEPIVHYNQVEEKMCIMIRGTAKEFIAKSGQDMEKETHKKYAQRINAPKTMVDLSELTDAKTNRKNDQFKSMASIYEEEESDIKPILKKENTLGHRRNRSNNMKSKTLTTSLNSLDNVNSGTYNSIPNDANPVTLPQIAAHSDEDLADSALLREDGFGVDEELLRHLRRFPKTYFVGDTLKIKYNRTIGTGDYFGRRAINKKSLSKQVIVADEECHCIVLHKDDYLMALEAEKSLHRDKINFFKQMFPQIDTELVTEFSLLWDRDSYKRSDIIYQEKDSSNRLFVVFEGEIIISKEVTEYLKSKLQSEGKKKDSYTFQVATLCQGYFFGEEFFKRKAREFTVTASSSKVKVLQLSLKDYKLLGKKYFEIFSNIQEMVQLSYKLNTQLLENLYQAHGVEVSRQAVHQDYIDNKEKLTKAETTTSRKDISSGPKQLLKPSKKSKNVNIRLQYDRYFVCKPGQKHPEYLKVVFKPENPEVKNTTETMMATKRRSSPSLEKGSESPEQAFNFVKPAGSLNKVPSQLYMTQSRSEETRENTTNEASLTTLRTRPAEDELGGPTRPITDKYKAVPKNYRSVSFVPVGSLGSIHSENEEELLANTSEMIPLNLQNLRNSCGSGNESEYIKKGVRSLENSLQSKLLRSTERNNMTRFGEFNPIMISAATSSNVYSNNVSITPKTSLNKQMPHTQRGMFSNVAKSMADIPSFSNVASVTTRSIIFDKEKPSGGVHLPAITRPQKKSVGSMKDLNEGLKGKSYSKAGSQRKFIIGKGK